MNDIYRGNNLVRQLVVIADFIILNSVLGGFYLLDSEFMPEFFDKATKITFFVANALLIVSEYFYSTVIHIRKVKLRWVFKRTLYLSLLTTLVFFVSLRLLNNNGKMFAFSIIFGIAFYLVLILSRFLELSILKHYRAKGYNSRTAIFVGNDPAIVEMFKTMTEDPSTGYYIRGYYADADITNAPDDLKRLGTLEDLDKIMSDSMNNTINGLPVNIEDLFCCLSHKDSTEIIKIMHFCDKNVIHFYYLPRQFGEYRLHLDAQSFMGKTVYSNRIEPLDSPSSRAIKRSFDIFVSGIICLCLLPIIPIIALCIKIQSPCNLFQAGKNGFEWRHLLLSEVPFHAREQRCRQGAGYQERPTQVCFWQLYAQDQYRRVSTVPQRTEGRHEHRRSTPTHASPYRGIWFTHRQVYGSPFL